ncbi:MAG: radical SAM protein [Desulfuromonadales bacterium]|nr:radical SAM protein [Desulfuromonadales bacterium]
MNILLISANTETVFMVPLPLGLNLLAVAAGNAGHGVTLLDLMGHRDYLSLIRDTIEEIRPGAIALSVRNIDNQNMADPRFFLDPVREIVAFCRHCSEAPIIVGGAGFSIFPEAVLRYLDADMGICGEGEVALVQLLAALESGEELSRISGICLPGRTVQNGCAERAALSTLPLPDPTLWQLPDTPNQDTWIPFQTRRGCPMRCSYCSTPALEGTTIRTHPVQAVVECVRRHVACGLNRFYFVDNVFNLPSAYAHKLCAGLREVGPGISWRCILYPGFIDEELVRNMAEAGCVEVSLGFESGNYHILANMKKKFSPQQVQSAAQMLDRHGIRRSGFLLLGGPGETRESVWESLAFADSLNLDTLKLTAGIRIYPGTAVARIACQEGMINPRDDLLMPRFYLAKGLEEWLPHTVREWMKNRPNCVS